MAGIWRCKNIRSVLHSRRDGLCREGTSLRGGEIVALRQGLQLGYGLPHRKTFLTTGDNTNEPNEVQHEVEMGIESPPVCFFLHGCSRSGESAAVSSWRRRRTRRSRTDVWPWTEALCAAGQPEGN